MYRLKNVKNFRGHEGEPVSQGTLHGPTSKVADWSESSTGGPLEVDFVSLQHEEQFFEWAKSYLVDFADFNGDPYLPLTMSRFAVIECSMEEMLDAHLTGAAEKKACTQGISFYLGDAKAPGGRDIHTEVRPYTPGNVALVRAGNPSLREIINERLQRPFDDEAEWKLAEQNKRFKQKCRKMTLFSVSLADGTLQYRQQKTPYTAAVAAALKAKWADRLVEIINERFL